MGQTSVISKKFDVVNKSLFPVVELELSGGQFEVGDKANTVRISRRGLKKLIYQRILSQTPFVSFSTSFPYFTYLGSG